MIRITVPTIDQSDFDAVREVLESGFLVQGPKVAEFERAVAEYLGTEHAIAVSSCTAALHLALLALDVRPGDRVAVAAYSWPATANVIVLCGAEPVFVDIQPDTFNMDPERLEAILKTTKLKAILPVHTFGNMADMPQIMELADRYEVPVVEDAACALGAEMQGCKAGTWGRMGCFSFHPRKAITTGEGGMIITTDARLARTLRALRNHGQDSDATSPDFVLAGFNYRMTDLQGALGTTQIAKLDRILTKRRELAAHYDEMLLQTPLRPPIAQKKSLPTHQSYVTLLPPEAVECRANLIRDLRLAGVEATIGTWHIPLTTFFRNGYRYSRSDFPTTDQVFDAALTLPLHEYLSTVDLQHVVCTLQNAIASSTQSII